MPPKKKNPVNINKRFVTVKYNSLDKKTLETFLLENKICDGYMIATHESGCIVKLYRKEKYHFVSPAPSFLNIQENRGIIIEDLEDAQISSLERDYIVDGKYFLKEPVIKISEPVAPTPEVKNSVASEIDWSSKSDIFLKALLTKRKKEFNLDEEGIKTLDRESIIMLLS